MSEYEERVEEVKKTIHFGRIMVRQIIRHLQKLESKLAAGGKASDVSDASDTSVQLENQIQQLQEGLNTLSLELSSAENLILPYLLTCRT